MRERGRAARKRIAVWALILPCLFVFSVVLIGNAFAGATTVGEAADDVSKGKRGGVTVVFESDDDDDDDDDWKSWLFGKSKRVCWVSESSAARIGAVYRTERITIGSRRVLIVYDAKKKQLRRLLGDAQRHCRLVRVRRAFFLPFDPHVS